MQPERRCLWSQLTHCVTSSGSHGPNKPAPTREAAKKVGRGWRILTFYMLHRVRRRIFARNLRRSYSIKLVPSARSAPSFPQPSGVVLPPSPPPPPHTSRPVAGCARTVGTRKRGTGRAHIPGCFSPPPFFSYRRPPVTPPPLFSLKSCCDTRVDGGRRGNELTVRQRSTVQGLKSTPRPAPLIPRMFSRYPTVQTRKMRPSLILSLDISASKFHPAQASLRVCVRGGGNYSA